MRNWRVLLLLAAPALAGAAATLVAGALAGMHGGDLVHLAVLLVPAALAVAVAVVVARPLVARSSFLAAMVATSAVSSAVGVVSLVVLSRMMFVSADDATTVVVLLLYSAAAGAGAAFVLAKTSVDAVRRLARTADALAEGDLEARVGTVRASPELVALGATIDRMAERLEAAVARVTDVEARRRDLVVAVSHDLRTPLAGLRAMVEAVEDEVVADPETFRRYAAEMRRSVDALVGMTDDLFELVQVDAGSIERETERARLADVVYSALAACKSQAFTKSVAIETRLNGAGEVGCSPRLVRVLQNLVQNAIRHTPADGSVRIEATRGDGMLRLAVEDSGEGIAPESVSLVFEPFWRGDPTRSGTGAGLGLALAKRIVDGLGGTIDVETAAPHGARFAVSLPAA
ncbi:MAG TPA: HAMP domain-containing sensor histidine kinase [Actinomycetota bacterium]|nr:HAMP domain-containing sensor histidine kinase [Actinomycetota bacterium]